VFGWIHRRGVTDPALMTDLPAGLRDRLREQPLTRPASVVQDDRSADGTRKLLVRLYDDRLVESVLIPRQAAVFGDLVDPDRAANRGGRYAGSSPVAQCLSSQVGCAMGCVFCASGLAGFKRNLSAFEIVSQVLLGRAQLAGEERLDSLVLMGMGEPLHNFPAVERALLLLGHPQGAGMALRRMTVSTCGLVPQIDRLAKRFDGRVPLAVSLHAADDRVRSELMPVNRKYPLARLMAALRRYPLGRGRRITIEYSLARGVNDSQQDARRLARLLEGIRVKVNLIPVNRVPGMDLEASPERRVSQFQERLRQEGVLALIRKRRGGDIAAACGQLALRGEVNARAVSASDPGT
jgi:23S rRNA (adenine2503-C2)-methyltransferase